MTADGRPQVYWNYRQRPQDRMALTVRSDHDPGMLTRSIIGEIRAVDPEQAVYDVRPMTEVVDRSLGQQWLTTAVLSAFAVVSLLMAAIGVYGVVSYGVRQRTHEFSVRMALGAARSHVMKWCCAVAHVWPDGAPQLALLAHSSRPERSRRCSTTSASPMRSDFAAAAGILALAALLATLIPARRAVNVEPATALQ